MDTNAVLKSWCDRCTKSINENMPERTGKHACVVARFLVSFWSSVINDGELLVTIFQSVHQYSTWISDSLAGLAWVTISFTPPENESSIVSVIINCDSDSDAVLTKLSFDAPPVIEL